MIDHVSVGVSDLAASVAFYDKVLAPLGLVRVAERDGSVAFGKTYPEFWLNRRADMEVAQRNSGCHICLRAPTADAVTAFHDTAIACGGRGDGEPGDRQGVVTIYFGAFVRDLDGNKIEAATFPRD